MPWLKRKAASLIGTIPTSSYQEAIGYFEASDAASPHPFAPNWLYIGKCYMQLKKWAEAKRWFAKVIQLEGSQFDPDHKEVTFSLPDVMHYRTAMTIINALMINDL